MLRCDQVRRVQRALLVCLVSGDLQDLLDQQVDPVRQVRQVYPGQPDQDLPRLVQRDTLDQQEYLALVDLQVQFLSAVT